MSIHDRNAYNDKKKSKDQIIFFYLIDYVDNHRNRYRYPKNLCCKEIARSAKRSLSVRGTKCLQEYSIYKVYTYSLFNVWPGVNMYNRKSVARAENPLLSFHVVDRVVSGRAQDGRMAARCTPCLQGG